jgi:hypothetical protein
VRGGQPDLCGSVGCSARFVVSPEGSGSGVRRINLIASVALVYRNAQLLSVLDRLVSVELVTGRR